MKKIILLIAFCSSVIVSAQNKIVYNLEKGGVYPQNQVMTSVQNQVINGMPQDITTKVVTESDFIVTDIIDGIYYIDVKINKMSNTTKTAMGSQEMDSDGGQANPMNKLFSNMIEFPIKITMNKQGEILSLDNSAQIENMTKDIDMPAMQLAQIEGAMKAEMSTEKQMSSYNLLTQILPKNAVSVGDTWNNTVTINSVIELETATTYKLESATEDFYTISANATIKTPEGSKMETMGLNANVNLAGPLTATYTLNRKTGWIQKAKVEQQLDGNMTIEKSEMMPQEMKIDMKTKTTTVIE
ncbi:MAG: DUF6263 family protein [Nonlabens sp.]|uniref:DUF6263 family protein n=1 Tax=Nonlabens sp. TaxID=1888209 RepID=UPI00321B4987